MAVAEVGLGSLDAAARAALGDVDRLLVYHVPLVTRFRRVTAREGLLVHGPAGWGEAAPFAEYGPAESAAWLRAAVAEACEPAPTPRRARVPVNVTIPVGSPRDGAARVRASGGCATAKVKVADPGVPLSADVARVEAVRDALAGVAGARARIRVDANAAWDEDGAVRAIRALDRAAGGLEYVEQPCRTVAELARVRARVDVPVAADESIRRAAGPLAVARAHAADVVVLKIAPLGGAARAVRIAAECGLEPVVSSAVETSVGLAAGARLAAALPGLVHACGLGTGLLLAGDVATRPLLPEDGAVRVGPVAVDESLVGARPLPAGADERWVARLGAMARAEAERGVRA